MRLPDTFHVARRRAENNHFKFSQDALLRLVDAVSDLALVIEDDRRLA